MHKEHKILELSDEKSFEKENITIESSTKDFNESNNKIIDLKNKIENEINKILKDVFAKDFLMGVSLSGRNVRIEAEQDLIRKEFNTFTSFYKIIFIIIYYICGYFFF